MMMPASAIVPSMATKPNGLPNDQQRQHDADEAERRRQHDHQRAREACSWIISSVEDDEQQQRHAGGDRTFWPRVESSIAPPFSIR